MTLVFAISPLFDAPYLRNALRYQRNLYIAEKYIRLAVIASETREMSRNSQRFWPYSSSKSSKVIDLGVNGKPMTLSVTIAVSATVLEIFTLKDRKLLILPATTGRPKYTQNTKNWNAVGNSTGTVGKHMRRRTAYIKCGFVRGPQWLHVDGWF